VRSLSFEYFEPIANEIAAKLAGQAEMKYSPRIHCGMWNIMVEKGVGT
jgi:hypothetical protein